jgi:hypothetical protein
MFEPSATVEGRVETTRPSLCLLVVVMAVGIAALAPSAQAVEPDPLALTATNPPSSSSQPAQSLTPLLQGRGDGGITTVVGGSRAVGGFPGTSAIDDDNPVEIYANGTCAGTPDWTGTVNELEGAGIEVEASPDTTTVYSAVRIDPEDEAHPSPCSNAFTYWHSTTPVTPPPGGGSGGEGSNGGTTGPGGSTAPPAPRLRTIPSGRANDNTPLVTGSAPGAITIKVFSTQNCSGTAVAKGSANDFAAGLQIQVADDSTNIFTAVSTAAGAESACSAPVTYVEDSTAPRTRITMGPGVKTRRRKAVFRFADVSGDPPGTTFLCKVDRKKWTQCTSPFKLKRLGFRRHVLRVRAIDLAGNAEAKGVKRRFKVVRAP